MRFATAVAFAGAVATTGATITSTAMVTVTSCAPEVTNCPGRTGGSEPAVPSYPLGDNGSGAAPSPSGSGSEGGNPPAVSSATKGFSTSLASPVGGSQPTGPAGGAKPSGVASQPHSAVTGGAQPSGGLTPPAAGNAGTGETCEASMSSFAVTSYSTQIVPVVTYSTVQAPCATGGSGGDVPSYPTATRTGSGSGNGTVPTTRPSVTPVTAGAGAAGVSFFAVAAGLAAYFL